MLKKGQAAMEFLMTYGWAILVVLIAIGALAYFGVLNPSRFLPESCTISPGISCEEHTVTEAGAATMIIRDGLGDNLNTIKLQLDDNNDGDYADAGETSTDCAGAATVADGATLSCSFAALATATAGTSGTKYKANIKMSYRQVGSTIDHTTTGLVQTKLE